MAKARSRIRSDQAEFVGTVREWCIEARIILASLVLSEPKQTASQRKAIRHLLGSARWIDTFKRNQSPWI